MKRSILEALGVTRPCREATPRQVAMLDCRYSCDMLKAFWRKRTGPALHIVMLCSDCLEWSRPLGGMARPGSVLLIVQLVVGLLGSARDRPHVVLHASAAQHCLCCIGIIALNLSILFLITLIRQWACMLHSHIRGPPRAEVLAWLPKHSSRMMCLSCHSLHKLSRGQASLVLTHKRSTQAIAPHIASAAHSCSACLHSFCCISLQCSCCSYSC